jgi:hypothetical protein
MDRVRRARFESKHLVELKRDDDAEDEREPEGHVEQEERFPPNACSNPQPAMRSSLGRCRFWASPPPAAAHLQEEESRLR